mgnify:CR=1 FL=1
MFALTALLIASCSKQTSDIIEWSTNGVTGVRMPLHVTFVENVQVEESAMQDAISISPAVGFDAYLSSFIRPSIIPDPPKKPSKKRSSPSLSTSSIENSLSLSYEDKRLYPLIPPPNLVRFPCRRLFPTTPPPCTPSVFPRFPLH